MAPLSWENLTYAVLFQPLYDSGIAIYLLPIPITWYYWVERRYWIHLLIEKGEDFRVDASFGRIFFLLDYS